MTALKLVWIALRGGKRLGIHATESGAKDRAETKYRDMCAFYGQPVGKTQWRPASERRGPGVQDLYVTHPERRFEPGEFCRADESVQRVEVLP